MKTKALRFSLVLSIMLILLLLGLILNINTGAVHIGAGEVLSYLWNALKLKLGSLFCPARYSYALSELMNSSTQLKILLNIRLPRVFLAAILGGALAVSGFLLQSFFRNPIAGPFVLGISGGAKMLVGITMIFLLDNIAALNSAVLVTAAFAGSLLVTGIVLIFAQRVRSMSVLLVIGIMVSYLCSAVTDFCITFADDHNIAHLTGWSMGSFSGASWNSVAWSAGICFTCLIAALLLSKPIGAYALGETYAKSLGLPVKAFRTALILLSSLMSACVTAFAGPISFVGIAIPHITRSILKTSRPSVIIPMSFLCGSVFCIYCDLLARTAFAPTELAISTVTSVFGAPIVIRMMNRRGQS